VTITPSASYGVTVRVEIRSRPGMLGRVTSAIGAVDIVELLRDRVVRDLTINARDDRHGQEIIGALRRLDGVAAQAIASIVGRSERHEEYIIPSVFNKKVAPAVAREVMKAAQKGGVARRRRRTARS